MPVAESAALHASSNSVDDTNDMYDNNEEWSIIEKDD